jgi:proteasome activator subunit 4
MLQFLSKLAEMHVDPSVSDPKRIETIPDDARSEGEGRPNWDKSDLNDKNSWSGLFKDVGIFSDEEWSLLMCKTLGSMGKAIWLSTTMLSLTDVLYRDSFEGLRLANHWA